MEISDENIISLVTYLNKTLSPDVLIRRPAEQFLESVEGNRNYGLLLLNVINKADLDITVRVTASITFKNYVKRNWPIDEDSGINKIHDEDRNNIKNLIVNLMLSSPELVQKQLSDAISIIGKFDFPDKWQNLLDTMIEKFATGDFSIINGVLQTAYSLFKKYRYEFKSQKLWTEIKFVLDKFAKPLTDLFVATMQLTETQTSPQVLHIIYNSLLFISKIFYCLNFQDIPEFFEDNMQPWMCHFHTLLTKDVPVFSQNSDTDEATVLDQVRTQICDNVTMYAQKYEEEFRQYLPNFVTDIWNLLTSTSREPKHDALVSNALQYLATVADRSDYHTLFEPPEVLSDICEKVIIPNMEFRVSDEELFEDNPEEYIRRDIEGSDVDTRRRAACDFIKVLLRYFEEKIIHIFGSYIQVMLTRYSESVQNWRSKDAALYLVVSLATRATTQRFGVTQTSSLVNLEEFASKHIIPELRKENVNEVPVIKADALKYLIRFRGVLPPGAVIESFPLILRFLDANSIVVHTYSAIAIEKILLVKDPNNRTLPLIKSVVLTPLLPNLLVKLIGTLSKPGSEENEHVMKAILRTFSSAQEHIVPLLPDILPQLLSKLGFVAKNPSKPNFNHYLFETIAISIKIVCDISPAGVNSFENELFPIFQIILQQDVIEFIPYVFQLLSMLLELHSNGDIPEPYMALYPFLLAPVLWERSGNIHPLVRLLTAYIAKCDPSEIDNNLKINSLLGIFQKLIGSRVNDQEGFVLIQNLIDRCPDEFLAPYIKQIFVLLFQRLTSSKTAKYMRGIITFFCFYIIHYGASNLITTMDSIQPQIFVMVAEKLFIAEAQSIFEPVNKKIVTVGLTKLITEAKELFDGPYISLWAPLLRVLLALFEKPEELKKDEDDELFDEIKEITYDAAYSRLNFASKAIPDPLQGFGDIRVHLSESLAKLSAQYPGKISPLITTGLADVERSVLKSYLDAASVQIS